MILFCKNDNVPAIKVYRALGFEPIDEFAIAIY
jgi:predicted GNAT family acetyltransferase